MIPPDRRERDAQLEVVDRDHCDGAVLGDTQDAATQAPGALVAQLDDLRQRGDEYRPAGTELERPEWVISDHPFS